MSHCLRQDPSFFLFCLSCIVVLFCIVCAAKCFDVDCFIKHCSLSVDRMDSLEDIMCDAEVAKSEIAFFKLACERDEKSDAEEANFVREFRAKLTELVKRWLGLVPDGIHALLKAGVVL